MFDLCVSRYRMSASTAGKRIGAARTARRFPLIFEMVARGEIHLTGIHLLKAHLTPENHERVLAEAKHKMMRQIEKIVACLAPKADVPSTLRALPGRPTTVLAPLAVAPHVPAAPVPAPVPRRSPDPAPLAPGRYKLQIILDEGTRQKLKQLQDLLAHQIPSGDPAAIVARALDALLIQVHKRKTGITERPRARKLATTPRTRSIVAALRRDVWTRDQGRCSFVGEDGHRCNETRRLEFGHLHPWGKRGENSAANLALRCRAHNAFEADRDFGASFMASKRGQRRARKPLKVREPVARYVARITTAGSLPQMLNLLYRPVVTRVQC